MMNKITCPHAPCIPCYKSETQHCELNTPTHPFIVLMLAMSFSFSFFFSTEAFSLGFFSKALSWWWSSFFHGLFPSGWRLLSLFIFYFKFLISCLYIGFESILVQTKSMWIQHSDFRVFYDLKWIGTLANKLMYSDMLLYITHNHALPLLSYHDYVLSSQNLYVCHHKKMRDC